MSSIAVATDEQSAKCRYPRSPPRVTHRGILLVIGLHNIEKNTLINNIIIIISCRLVYD